jgi:hypothetical protein
VRRARARLVHQLEALRHAEAVLLVHHHRGQVAEGHALAQQRVRPHDDVGAAVFDAPDALAALARAQLARQQHGREAQSCSHGRDVAEVLLGQHLGGHQPRHLSTRRHHLRAGQQRHGRLSAAHLALQHAAHGLLALEVGRHLTEGLLLCSGEGEGQLGRVLARHVRRDGAGARRQARLLGAPPLQRQLQQEEFFHGQPPVVRALAAVPLGQRVGRQVRRGHVQRHQRMPHRPQARALTKGRRDGVRHEVAHPRHRRANGLAQRGAGHAGNLGVARDDHAVLRVHLGVRDGQRPAVLVHPAVDSHRGPHREALLEPRQPVKPDQPQLPIAPGRGSRTRHQAHLGQPAPPPRRRLRDRAHHALGHSPGPRGEFRDGEYDPLVIIAPRQQPEQVTHRH